MTTTPWLHTVIDVPSPHVEVAAEFWGRALGWPAGQPWPGHAELRSLEPDGGTPYVHLQRIAGPPRVHLDVQVEDPDATVDLAVGLGAGLEAGSDRWQTLRSPGGLPFCVLAGPEPRLPDPVTWPGGHRSRLVQVCIDSPTDRHDDEVSFWRRLLPGQWASSDSSEFAGKWHHDGSPLQLLFQRLDDPVGDVRAHLDHGTDDLEAEVDRLVDLGAQDVAPGRGWRVLRDPVGLEFCVTENSPASDHRRHLD